MSLRGLSRERIYMFITHIACVRLCSSSIYMWWWWRQRLARLKSRLGIQTARRYHCKRSNEMKVAGDQDDTHGLTRRLLAVP